MRSTLLVTTALLALQSPAFATDAPPTTRAITAPAAMLPAAPGSDYFLANYTQTTAWLKKIAGESDRLRLVSIGKTAEGREQWMAIVSSPENLAKLDHYREIAQRLALAKGLTDDQAHALAQEGKAVVWIDAGIHATEVVNAQAHLEIITDLITGNDPETLRLLGDNIALFVWANPDGQELVANWYMRPSDPKKRNTNTIPVLYQKYIGHDDNRDSFAVTQPETTNINRAGYREWFPQILYNEHQTGPEGTVVFIPPFRDPYNFNNEPLVINQTDVLAYHMHQRLVERDMGGSVMRSGAPYSTWFNGGLRTVGYFHNQIGILTEIIGNPTPMKIPLVLKNQLPREDEVMTIAPQEWHFQQSIDYVRQMDRAVLDYASRYRETVLYNRYVMGRNQIQKGSQDSWVITPKRLAAVRTAAGVPDPAQAAPASESATVVGREDRPVPSELYDKVLKDPKFRAPRAYIIPADGQPDLPTTIAFLNALLKNGIEVERAPAPFDFAGKHYAAGSFVVRTDQAFRPHVLDMFEPQDHPQDFAYPGGPPLKPYDITGYTLALQMNVNFDRDLDAAPPHFPLVPDVMTAPPPGHILGKGGAGWVVSHATDNSFTLANRLLKANAPFYWIKSPVKVGGQTLAPGALWIPASAQARSVVTASVGPLGVDVHAVSARPAGSTIMIKNPRIGLVDLYGGSMASGWTRWIFEQFEFPYTKIFPQELDKGDLNKKYDVIVLQSDVLGRGEDGSGRGQPKPEDIPADYAPWLGRITKDKTYPMLAAFARAGGTVIAVGNATAIGPDLGLPVANALEPIGADGKPKPLPSSKFYVPGSILTAKVDTTNPLAYGMPETVNLFYYNNPVFTTKDASIQKVSWFYNDDPLVSGWAWGQKQLNGTAPIVAADVGQGHVYLLGAEVTQRGQPYATFKFLFNGVLFGPSVKGGAPRS
jgi:hypothetical protein